MLNVAVVVPTNNPAEYFQYMHLGLSSLVGSKRARYIFAFAFQPPFEETKIGVIAAEMERLHFTFRFTLVPQETPPSLFRLRHQAAQLVPEADILLFADDNLVFQPKGTAKYPGGTVERYDECLEYMEHFANCGMVMCEGSLGGDVQRREIRPTTSGLISTTRGLFVRAGSPLYLPDELALDGGMEELILAYRLMGNGQFIAKQFNNPTRHANKTRVYDNVQRYHPTNYAVIQANAERYVRERWDDPKWTLERRRIPKRVFEEYTRNGGDQKAFQDLCSQCGNTVLSEKYWRNYVHKR